MNAEKCVVCGAVIPEGRKVCPICERKAEETDTPPTGWIGHGDISQMSYLRGQQITELLKEWGVMIGGRRYLKFETFDRLRSVDMLRAYLKYPVYIRRVRGKVRTVK